MHDVEAVLRAWLGDKVEIEKGDGVGMWNVRKSGSSDPWTFFDLKNDGVFVWNGNDCVGYPMEDIDLALDHLRLRLDL